MVLSEAVPGGLPLPGQAADSKRRHTMGEKGGKKDKNKADKQKQKQQEKKQEQHKNKLPSKKPS
jgi:hypothetical protein